MRRRLTALALTASVLLGACSDEDAEAPDRSVPSPASASPESREPTPVPLPEEPGARASREAATEELRTGETGPESPPTVTATGEAWVDAPNDGTWEGGDVPFGVVRELPGAHEYTFAVRELPMMTTVDGSDEVTATSVVEVERVEDHASGGAVAEHLDVSFHPGNFSASRHDEKYGTRTGVVCAPAAIALRESAACTVSFTAEADEVPNFSWVINGQHTAAWPSQT